MHFRRPVPREQNTTWLATVFLYTSIICLSLACLDKSRGGVLNGYQYLVWKDGGERFNFLRSHRATLAVHPPHHSEQVPLLKRGARRHDIVHDARARCAWVVRQHPVEVIQVHVRWDDIVKRLDRV